MIDKITLGKRIKALRDACGLSQAQIAECVEVDQSLISKIESGERTISSSLLEQICDIFCYPVEYLLDDKQDVKPASVISFRTASLSSESIKSISVINRIFLNQMKMDEWGHLL